jgi:hypothetical protein
MNIRSSFRRAGIDPHTGPRPTKSDLTKSNWETIQDSKTFGSKMCQSLIYHGGEDRLGVIVSEFIVD